MMSLVSTVGLITTSLDELVILNTSVPLALKLKSLPPASNTISPAESKVIVVPSTSKVPSAVI